MQVNLCLKMCHTCRLEADFPKRTFVERSKRKFWNQRSFHMGAELLPFVVNHTLSSSTWTRPKLEGSESIISPVSKIGCVEMEPQQPDENTRYFSTQSTDFSA